MLNDRNRLRKRRVPVMVFAILAAWFLMVSMFAFSGNEASAASKRVLGYEIYYYTDSSFSFQCGYYNSCTKFRSGCLTPHQERWGIACGER